ncbi:MAG: Rpn family recombination-promoting nuclease/putative transposase [Lachnospiraceae bacterium]|nr:Rpn family recombination-promoting nuclease/putative transposase [Lachnospiraceae bacterium]
MAKTPTVTFKPNHRPLEELNLIDDFLFQELLSQENDGEEFCRILLGTILNRPIRKVRIMPQKNVLGLDTGRHGIRMDAYIEDISNETTLPGIHMADAKVISDIYDIEPNNRYEKQTLPKRMRYYHGLIDTQLLSADIKYDKLKNVIIIVILPYDPFGKNRMIYTIQNQCIEDTSIPYDDGAKKIFLYTKGTEGNPSQTLKDMLKYIERTVEDNVTNQDIDTIHQFVKKVKRKKEVGINYMKSWELEEIYREEAREEGLAEGRAKGHAEGLEQGIAVLIKTCRSLSLSSEDICSRLVENFSLTTEKAEEYIRKYGK